MFVPNFKILGAVIPENSLTAELLHKQTYKHTYKQYYGNDKKYIPLLYFVCRGYNKQRVNSVKEHVQTNRQKPCHLVASERTATMN